jgi:two-component system chemotaxis sensor kinase CheA
LDPERIKKIAELFRAEVKGHLSSLSDNLASLERNPTSQSVKARVEEIFRLFHTLKGCSRALGVVGIEVVCQRLENLFNEVRMGSRKVDAELLELAVKCLETVRSVQDCGIQVSETDPRIQEFLNRYAAFAKSQGIAEPAPKPGEAVFKTPEPAPKTEVVFRPPDAKKP